jgi:hypothetical protein
MKTVTRLHFSTFVRAARVVLLIVVMTLLAVTIVEMLPRGDDATPTGSEQPSHYNFPTYA